MDLNGTLARDGRVLDGIPERLDAFRASLQVHMLTAGTHGGIDDCARQLGVQPLRKGTGEEKGAYVRTLGTSRVVAMGNGANDALMLTVAVLGIAMLGPEGLCMEAVRAADIVVADPRAGLDLLLHPDRLVATLRR